MTVFCCLFLGYQQEGSGFVFASCYGDLGADVLQDQFTLCYFLLNCVDSTSGLRLSLGRHFLGEKLQQEHTCERLQICLCNYLYLFMESTNLL